MAGHAIAAERGRRPTAAGAVRRSADWVASYLRWAALTDGVSALAAGVLAIELRFVRLDQLPIAYVVLTAALSALWCGAAGLAGGYDARFIRVGPDELRGP